MSNQPNNPFESSGERFGQPPQKKSNVWLWVIGIIGGFIVVGALVCCGGLYFTYQAGKTMLAESIRTELRGNPVIEENLGEIQSLEMNLGATGQQNQGQDGPDVLVFDAEGSKGSGQIAVRPDQAGGFTSAELILPDGERIELESSDEMELSPDDISIPEVDSGEPVPQPPAEGDGQAEDESDGEATEADASPPPEETPAAQT